MKRLLGSKTIKSKDRVRNYGEVYTQEREVNAMLDLVHDETERIESRFLEPACGTGNFLTPILERKLTLVKKKYSRSQAEFERMAILAVSSIYGVDLLSDNIEDCQNRLYDVFNELYTILYEEKCKEEMRSSIRYVFRRNILHGDALTLKYVNGNQKHIIFSEWSLVRGGMIKRRDFQFIDLAEFDPNKPSLFSIKEVSDIGETVFLPQPVKEFPLTHYLSLNHEETK